MRGKADRVRALRTSPCLNFPPEEGGNRVTTGASSSIRILYVGTGLPSDRNFVLACIGRWVSGGPTAALSNSLVRNQTRYRACRRKRHLESR